MALKKAGLILFLAAALPLVRQLFWGAGILDDDLFLQSLPAWEWLGTALRTGESPLWSPELLGGFPIAFTQYPFLYPPALLLAWLLPGPQAYAWAFVLHLFLAGFLTYLYCRFMGFGFGSALLGGLCFELSSEVVAGSSGFAAMSAFALPGTMLAVEMVIRSKRAGGPVLAVVVAAALLGGHPQLVLMSLVAGGCYALFRLAQLASSAGRAFVVKAVLWLALAVAIGVCGAAVRLLPTWGVVEMSTRASGLPAGAGASGALSPVGLVLSYLLPLTRMQSAPWGAAGYAGPAVLLLALVGARTALQNSLGRFFLMLAAISALLSLGDATPLSILNRLPLASFFREPARFSLVTTFALCVLGGMALDVLSAEKRNGDARRMRVLVAACALAAATVLVVGGVFQFGNGSGVDALRSWSQEHHLDLLNPWRPRMMLAVLGLPASAIAMALAANGTMARSRTQLALVTISAAILVPLAAILNPALGPDVLAKAPDTAGLVSQQSADYRVFSHRAGVRLYNHMQFYGPGPEAAFSDDLRYRYQAAMLSPILNLRWGIASADGYEQLHSVAQDRLLRFIDAERISDWAQVDGRWAHVSMADRVRVMSLLNVRYLLSYVDLTPQVPELKIAGRFDVAPGPSSRASLPVYVFENPSVLPRYYLVNSARVFYHDGELLDSVAYGEIDPRKEVAFLLGEEPRSAAAGGEGASAQRALASPVAASDSRVGNGLDAAGQPSVNVLSRHNAAVELRVVADRPGYLVTSDSYWPGWRAYVDGREVPMLRANAGGRAVEIAAAGAHTVEMRYEPVGFGVGMVISIGACLLLVGWSILPTSLVRQKASR